MGRTNKLIGSNALTIGASLPLRSKSLMLSVSLIALGSGGVLADPVVISTDLTSPQTISVDEDITVTSLGSVTLTNEPNEEVIEIDVADYSADLIVDGVLEATSVDLANNIWVNNFGVKLVDVGASGSVTNSGSIFVRTTKVADNGPNSAYQGSIGATSNGIDTKILSGTVLNNGTIEVETIASGSVTSTMSAYGFGLMQNTVQSTGAVENAGTISVVASTDGNALSSWTSAIGQYIVNNYGALVNNGSIVVTATSDHYLVSGGILSEAGGVGAWDNNQGASMMNNGSVVVSSVAEGTSATDAIKSVSSGLAAWEDSLGTILNSGSVESTATVSGVGNLNVSARAYGIAHGRHAGNAALGSVTNTGSIVAVANAAGTSANGDVVAEAYGIRAVGVDGSISNTGSITVSADSVGISSAVGIETGTLNGTLYNSGAVLAYAQNAGSASAIKVVGGSGTATFSTESFFVGSLDLTNAALEVETIGNTPSIYWTFDNIPSAVTLTDQGGPQLFHDNNIVATVAPVNLAFSGQIAAEIANLSGSTLGSLLAEGSTGIAATTMNKSGASTAPLDATGRYFVEGGFVSRTVDDAGGTELGFDVGNLTAGYVDSTENGLDFGLSLSGVRATGSAASGLGADKVDTDGFVFGAYGNTTFGAASLTFGASVGILSNTGTRSYNDNLSQDGLSEVNSDYNSRFFSPSVELSWLVKSGDMTFRPHMGYRHTKLHSDGFTETGGAAAASFDSRSVSSSDITVGFDASRIFGDGTLTGSADVLKRVVNDDGANFNLFGDSGSTANADSNFTALNLSINYSVAKGPGALNIGASGMVGKNVSGYGLAANYVIEF